MNKVLSINQAIKITQNLRKTKKTVVLAGGCFDILHTGHIMFLEAAKKEGDILILLLESDESTRKRKGEGRPINSQNKRINALSKLETVDYIVPLIGVTKDEEYDRLMVQIKPDIVAITKGDPETARRFKQCGMIGAKLRLVINKIEGLSTTVLINETKE